MLQTAAFARVSARTNCGTTVFLESDGICLAAIIWRAVLCCSGYFVVERRPERLFMGSVEFNG
jgi:hypothetical protein